MVHSKVGGMVKFVPRACTCLSALLVQLSCISSQNVQQKVTVRRSKLSRRPFLLTRIRVCRELRMGLLRGLLRLRLIHTRLLDAAFQPGSFGLSLGPAGTAQPASCESHDCLSVGLLRTHILLSLFTLLIFFAFHAWCSQFFLLGFALSRGIPRQVNVCGAHTFKLS